jgi:hypothetical protein
MARPIILSGIDNIVPSSIVTASTARSGYPISNIRINSPIATWRSNAAVQDGILIDHGGENNADAIAIINCNFTSNAVVKLKRGSTINCLNVTESIAPGGDDIFKLITPSLYQYSKIELADPTNSDGYLEIGCLWLGSRMRLSYGMAQNFSFLDVQDNTDHANGAGSRQVEHLFERVRMSLQFEGLDSWEADELADLWQSLKGDALPLFVIPDHDVTEGYWMRMQSLRRIRGVRDDFQIELEELSRG